MFFFIIFCYRYWIWWFDRLFFAVMCKLSEKAKGFVTFQGICEVTDCWICLWFERYWIILSYSVRISYIIYWGSMLSIIIQNDRIKVLNRECPKVILLEISEELNQNQHYLDWIANIIGRQLDWWNKSTPRVIC